MKSKTNTPTRPTLRGLVLALAATVLAGYVATAHPYATCLTNTAGTISFRLNESADTVRILWAGGASSYTIGALPPGLTETNLTLPPASVTVTSPFQVEVFKVGSGAPSQILPTASTTNNTIFENPRAIAVNKRPGSPYFGRIYVGNVRVGTAAAGRAVGDGIYVLNADQSDALGQGNTALTGGLDMVNFAATFNTMPFRIRVGQDDDMLYICNWSDTNGPNLYRVDPNVSATSGTNMFKAFEPTDPIQGAKPPVGIQNNHGSIAEVYVTGSLATGDLTVYSVDEDYESDPSIATLSQLNSLWRYDVGSANSGVDFPWSNAPNALIATPSVGFVSQTMGLDRGTNGYLYLLDSRSAGNENLLQVIDPAGPTVVWESRATSLALGLTVDALAGGVSVAVSPDMKYCAVQLTGGSVVLMRMNAGIPDLAGRTTFAAIGTARQIVFDAADNLYVESNVTERMRIWSLGATTTATTTSDGTFGLSTPATEVSVTVDTPTVSEAGATTATFTMTRANYASLTDPLRVNFNMTGTGTRTTDYVLKTNGVTFTGTVVYIPATQTSVTVTLTAVDDFVAELTETAILTIAGAGDYSSGSPNSASVSIVDNEKPMIDVSLVQGSVYERLTNDYARVRLTRRGDTNAAAFGANVSWAGTAAGTRYTVPANPVVTFNPGDLTLDVDVSPVNDSLLQGNQTIICTVAAAGASEYTVGTNAPLSATATIVDDEDLPETTILYSENFNTDNTANWTTNFGSANDLFDARYVFNYDYAGGLWIPAIPPAPHSTADTLGLYMTVNKDEATGVGAAGINTYPVGQSFSGNYAVRFDMYLMVGNAASTTEYALFGVAHSGTKTNWFRNSAGGVPGGGSYDGLWFGVEADGAALGDYVIYSAPTTAGNNPTALTPGVNASTLTGIFKNPPYGGNILAGAPGCTESSATPCWSDVEISKIGGYIRLRINHSFIMSYTAPTANTNGDIMLGYCDAYDSIMAGASGVVYDNLRVVKLDDLKITDVKLVGTNTVVTFTWGIDDPTTVFKLQSSANVASGYADTTTPNTPTIAKLSPGVYTATVGTVKPRFHRIRYAGQ